MQQLHCVQDEQDAGDYLLAVDIHMADKTAWGGLLPA